MLLMVWQALAISSLVENILNLEYPHQHFNIMFCEGFDCFYGGIVLDRSFAELGHIVLSQR